MSKIEVNQIGPQCGTTLTVGCGVGQTVNIDANTVTLGRCGATVSLAAGATAAGFGSTGEVSWNTTKITADPSNAVSGVGYFADTTSAAFTITLPTSPSAGNVVAISDYAGTFFTNNLTVGRNGSNINGAADDFILSKNNVTAQFIYVDATQGWRVVFTGDQTGGGLLQGYMSATGGTETTCGNYKIHTFTGPGTFTVNSLACSPANNVVDYLVIAGGASGGGGSGAGGGGAGGYRESSGTASGCYTVSPLGACVSALPVSVQGYPITVGGGGAPLVDSSSQGNSGSSSVFSTITSSGGGGGGGENTPAKAGVPGGSGGGAQGNPGNSPGGTGNTPPVAPPQGSNGGPGVTNYAGGGGGGATGTGGTGPNPAGAGGTGGTSSINGTPTGRAGGGGGGQQPPAGNGPGPGTDGGGNGGLFATLVATNGTANTGGGGGGGAFLPSCSPNSVTGAGGSGIVIIRYRYQ